MSFREITMQDVSEVLRRWQAGQSARRIARETGLDRKTVGRYLDEAKASGVLIGTAVTEDMARAVGKEVQSRPLPPPSQQWQALVERRDQINAWLVADRPLRLVRVHELLQRQEVAAGYTTLRRYAQRDLGWRKKQPTLRLDDPAPGLEAQIDFGLMGTISDEAGHQRRLYVLIVTPSSSRYSFIWPTWRQTGGEHHHTQPSLQIAAPSGVTGRRVPHEPQSGQRVDGARARSKNEDLDASGWLGGRRLSSNRDLHTAPPYPGGVGGIARPERLAAWAVLPAPIAGLPCEGGSESQGSLLGPEAVVSRERHDFPHSRVVAGGERGRKVIVASGNDHDLLTGFNVGVKMPLIPGMGHRVHELGVVFIGRFLRVPD
jgi:hypothetical protein